MVSYSLSELDKSKYMNHFKIGIDYLIKIGYRRQDIKVNNWGDIRERLGKPDITTINDGKNWEVKEVNTRSKIIYFTEAQKEKMNREDIILIFSKDNRDFPVDIIIFGDILDRKYDNRYKFKVQYIRDLL